MQIMFKQKLQEVNDIEAKVRFRQDSSESFGPKE